MAAKKDQPTDGIRQVIEAEIIDPDYHDAGRSQQTTYTRRATTYTSNRGPVFAEVFTAGPLSNSGCVALAIPLGLFLFCLGSYGFLAALGFGVFYLIGSVIGTLTEARWLIQGRPFNPWAWRVGNWLVSFLITLWLAGGLNG